MINNRKNKHMVLDDLIEIQECLNKGMTFRAIAERICKDPTTDRKRRSCTVGRIKTVLSRQMKPIQSTVCMQRLSETKLSGVFYVSEIESKK